MKKCPYCGKGFNFWQFWWKFGFMAQADNPMASLTMFTEHNTCDSCNQTFILSYPKENLKKSSRKLAWILATPVSFWFILKNFIHAEALFVTIFGLGYICVLIFLTSARYSALELKVDPNPIKQKQERGAINRDDKKRMVIVWIIIVTSLILLFLSLWLLRPS